MKKYKICVLPGDGIGPEVISAAIKVLDKVQENENFELDYSFGEAGFSVIKKYGTNLPEETIKILRKTQACLKGPMTTPEEEGSPPSVAVQIRKMLDLYANIRPCKTLPNSGGRYGIDMIIVRENTEGLYYGKERKIPGGAIAERLITEKACKRTAEHAFELANKRRKKLVYVHKANILKITDGVFIKSVLSVSKKFPEVKADGMHVDAAAMQIVKKPEQFDVIVTTNLFGDILSGVAAQITGGIGLAPGANIGKNYSMFEPVHGSAPKYAGKNIANPIATILAAKMMLDYLGESRAAERIENSVNMALKSKKALTRDLGGKVTTKQVGEVISKLL